MYGRRTVGTPASYKMATIGRGNMIQTITANGALSAVKTSTVGSQVSGSITEKVDHNAHVTNGQVISQIDPSTLQQVDVFCVAMLSRIAAGFRSEGSDSLRLRELKPHFAAG